MSLEASSWGLDPDIMTANTTKISHLILVAYLLHNIWKITTTVWNWVLTKQQTKEIPKTPVKDNKKIDPWISCKDKVLIQAVASQNLSEENVESWMKQAIEIQKEPATHYCGLMTVANQNYKVEELELLPKELSNNQDEVKLEKKWVHKDNHQFLEAPNSKPKTDYWFHEEVHIRTMNSIKTRRGNWEEDCCNSYHEERILQEWISTPYPYFYLTEKVPWFDDVVGTNPKKGKSRIRGKNKKRTENKATAKIKADKNSFEENPATPTLVATLFNSRDDQNQDLIEIDCISGNNQISVSSELDNIQVKLSPATSTLVATVPSLRVIDNQATILEEHSIENRQYCVSEITQEHSLATSILVAIEPSSIEVNNQDLFEVEKAIGENQAIEVSNIAINEEGFRMIDDQNYVSVKIDDLTNSSMLVKSLLVAADSDTSYAKSSTVILDILHFIENQARSTDSTEVNRDKIDQVISKIMYNNQETDFRTRIIKSSDTKVKGKLEDIKADSELVADERIKQLCAQFHKKHSQKFLRNFSSLLMPCFQLLEFWRGMCQGLP